MNNNFDEGLKHFNEKMRAGAFKEATKIKSDYNLPNDILQVAGNEAYEKCMREGDYSIAADLAKQYDLPAAMRTDAAMRSFRRKIDDAEFCLRLRLNLLENSICLMKQFRKLLSKHSIRA